MGWEDTKATVGFYKVEVACELKEAGSEEVQNIGLMDSWDSGTAVLDTLASGIDLFEIVVFDME